MLAKKTVKKGEQKVQRWDTVEGKWIQIDVDSSRLNSEDSHHMIIQNFLANGSVQIA